jgi:hypothetical protein
VYMYQNAMLWFTLPMIRLLPSPIKGKKAHMLFIAPAKRGCSRSIIGPS